MASHLRQEHHHAVFRKKPSDMYEYCFAERDIRMSIVKLFGSARIAVTSTNTYQQLLEKASLLGGRQKSLKVKILDKVKQLESILAHQKRAATQRCAYNAARENPSPGTLVLELD